MSKKTVKQIKLLIWTTVMVTMFNCGLLSGQTTPTPPPPAPTLEPEASQVASPSDQVEIDYTYTSELITVIYPLYGEILEDYLDVEITNHGAEAVQVIVSSEIQGFTDKSTDTVNVAAGESVSVQQNPLLIPEKIDQLNTEKPANFHLQVAYLENGEGRILLDQTHETIVYGRRDFPWAIEGFNDEEVFELTAAMVMPNDPSVEELIRVAADYTDSGIMTSGYKSVGDADGKLWDRLEAIWEAEDNDYDLTYIDTEISFAAGSVQRIRLPAETLEQKSGNCIELAVLFASAAEALDLEAALLRMPGHAFVAVRTDLENADYYFIETTLIGRADFETAVTVGRDTFNEILPMISEHETYYDWITIADAREKGIMPLPWH